MNRQKSANRFSPYISTRIEHISVGGVPHTSNIPLVSYHTYSVGQPATATQTEYYYNLAIIDNNNNSEVLLAEKEDPVNFLDGHRSHILMM